MIQVKLDRLRRIHTDVSRARVEGLAVDRRLALRENTINEIRSYKIDQSIEKLAYRQIEFEQKCKETINSNVENHKRTLKRNKKAFSKKESPAVHITDINLAPEAKPIIHQHQISDHQHEIRRHHLKRRLDDTSKNIATSIKDDALDHKSTIRHHPLRSAIDNHTVDLMPRSHTAGMKMMRAWFTLHSQQAIHSTLDGDNSDHVIAHIPDEDNYTDIIAESRNASIDTYDNDRQSSIDHDRNSFQDHDMHIDDRIIDKRETFVVKVSSDTIIEEGISIVERSIEFEKKHISRSSEEELSHPEKTQMQTRKKPAVDDKLSQKTIKDENGLDNINDHISQSSYYIGSKSMSKTNSKEISFNLNVNLPELSAKNGFEKTNKNMVTMELSEMTEGLIDEYADNHGQDKEMTIQNTKFVNRQRPVIPILKFITNPNSIGGSPKSSSKQQVYSVITLPT